MLAFAGVALVLRILGPLGSGLWHDEIWLLVDTIQAPFGDLFTTFESDNKHPLYSVLAWISAYVLGEGAVAIRLRR